MVIGGQAKIGKSFVVNSLLRALATGSPLFGLHQFSVSEPVRSLYVENEIGEIGLQTRALTGFADMEYRDRERMFYIPKDLASELKLDTPITSEVGFNYWREIVGDVAPQVLIIDPLAAFHTTDENDAVEFEKIFHRLERLKAIHPERLMSIVVIHHSGKPSKDSDALNPYAMRGSSKIYDRPDTLLMLDRKKNLPVDHEAWELDARFKVRQGPGFDDLKLHVNEHNDGLVKFAKFKTVGGALPKLQMEKIGDKRVLTTTGSQLSFTPD